MGVVSRDERIKQTPKSNGEWRTIWGTEGKRGTCRFYPSDKERKKLLAKYGTEYVQYDINAEPDFSIFKEVEVKIPNMEGGTTQSRRHNFNHANQLLVGTEWAKKRGLHSASDIERYRIENRLCWHEKSDGVTMQLIPSDINSLFGHLGGVSTIANMDVKGEGVQNVSRFIEKNKIKALQRAVQTELNVKNFAEEANRYIGDCTKKYISENWAEINRSGVDEAANAAQFSAALSVTKNILEVVRGKESVQDAEKDVLVDVSSSAAVGYATGAVMKKFSTEYEEASVIVAGTIQISKQVISCISGEIDEHQMMENVAETTVFITAGYCGKVVGGTIGELLAGKAGQMIGQYFGEIITTAVCSDVIDTIRFNKEFEKNNSRMIALYKGAEREIRNSQERLESLIEEDNKELKQAILEGFRNMADGIQNDTYEQVEKGMSIIGSSFNLTIEEIQRGKITRDTLFSHSEEVLVIE